MRLFRFLEYYLRVWVLPWWPLLLVLAGIYGLKWMVRHWDKPVRGTRATTLLVDSAEISSPGGEVMTFDSALALGESEEGMDLVRDAMTALNDDVNAQLWLAKDWLSSAEAGPSVGELSQARRHLERAVTLDPKNNEAVTLLLGVFRRQGASFEAEQLLNVVVSTLPEFRLSLASLYEELGRSKEAKLEAERASAYFEEESRRRSGPNSGIDSWIRWLKAEAMLGDTEKIRAIGKASLRMFPENRRIKDHIVAYHLSLCNEEMERNPTTINRILEPFKTILDLTPTEASIIGQLERIALHPETNERARGLLETMMARPDASSLVYYLMGVQARDYGDYDRSIALFEKTLELDPTSPHARKQLAWTLAETTPPQIDRSLELINGLIEEYAAQTPLENPMYLEVRGQILVKAGRMKEAIADLVLSLRYNKSKNRIEVHEALSRAYDSMGNDVMANAHRLQLTAGGESSID